MVKRLLQSLREYKRDTLLTPIIITGEVLMEVLLPLLMAQVIDYLSEYGSDGDLGYIAKLGLILFGCCVISLSCGAFAGSFAASASSGFARNLRKDMYYNVQNFSFQNIDKFSTASIVTRLTTDVTNIQNAFQQTIRSVARSPLMLLFCIIASMRISTKVAWIFLVMVPILGLGLYVIATSAHPVFTKVFSTYDKLNLVVQENLYGIRVVKSFVREDYEERKFTTVSAEIRKLFTKAERILAFNGPLMQFCSYACMILISWCGAKIIVESGGTEMSTGNLTALFTYIMQIMMSLMMAAMIIIQLVMAKASGERIVEILDEKPTITNRENPVRTVANGDVDFEDVVFSYSQKAQKDCLSHINVHIESGQTVGIIGGTGSSKSTFVQLIPRLYEVTQGKVKVGGLDVKDYDLEVLRDNVAMVLQKNVLFTGTIKDNLRWGNPEATDEQIIHACKLAQADPFIQEFPDKYDTFIEQGGKNVSGGQKQRLCIARALLKKPKILILDDSTSAVDTKTDALIRKAFRQEIPYTTKFIIAQRIASVEEADVIIVLDDGKINGVGTHKELLESNQIYREVYTSQLKGEEDNARTR